MSTSSKFSLRENIRFRILKEMIANLKQKFPSVPNFIMILDPTTTKIVSSSVRTVDLIEEGVLGFERLELGRKQFPDSHAIYFVTPTENSINAILNDFADPDDPQYGNVHLFFTNKVDSQLFTKLKKQKSLVERVMTFKEINLDFMNTEANVFNLDLPEILTAVYSYQGHPNVKPLEEKIANGLSTVLPNLIDFNNIQIVYNKNPHNNVAERVAYMAAERIRKFIELKKPNDDDSDEDEVPVPVKIVILDRTFDPLTPSLRDYYYESLVYEFLDIKGNIIEYNDTDNDGQVVKKMAVLDDKDEVWEKYKNQFISEVKVNIGAESQDFIRNNSTAQMRRTMKIEEMDPSQLAEFLKGMPAFEALFAKYVLHTTLIESIDKIFAEKDLADIGNLEQCLATGYDAQGKLIPSQKLIAMIAQKIAQGKLDDETKLRLMIITSFALELNERERKSLTQSLPEDGKDVLAKLSWLGLGEKNHALISGKINKKMQEPQNPNKDKLKNIPRTLCRHVPLIESIAQDMAANRVDPKQYGSIEIPETYDGTFLQTSPKKKNRREEDLTRLPKLIMFVIGGVTHSELRVLTEYEKANPNLNVLIGSTDIITVRDYIRGIANMASKGEHQAINIDDEY